MASIFRRNGRRGNTRWALVLRNRNCPSGQVIEAGLIHRQQCMGGSAQSAIEGLSVQLRYVPEARPYNFPAFGLVGRSVWSGIS